MVVSTIIFPLDCYLENFFGDGWLGVIIDSISMTWLPKLNLFIVIGEKTWGIGIRMCFETKMLC